MSLAYIYIIKAGDSVKVGIASDPNKRLRQLQSGNPEKMALAKSFGPIDRSLARTIEVCVHDWLASYRKAGEWFSCSADEAIRSVAIVPALISIEMGWDGA